MEKEDKIWENRAKRRRQNWGISGQNEGTLERRNRIHLSVIFCNLQCFTVFVCNLNACIGNF